MEEDQNTNEQSFFFEEIVKKTKTGITFPKNLRELLFEEGVDLNRSINIGSYTWFTIRN